MTDSNRRSFLKHTAAASAGAAAWAWTGRIPAAGTNERLTVGIIGCGGRDAGLTEEFAGLANVAYVCDPDAAGHRIAAAEFAVQQKPDRLLITDGGRPVATYVFRDDKILRLHFANVHAPGGIQVTRSQPPVPGVDATDHDTMHPGVWLAFGDQEEMGLGLRVATPIAVKQGGTIRDARGRRNEREVWGNAADGCDCSGIIDGRHAGITTMCDPQNFRPRWLHARDYGALVVNPFGQQAFRKGAASKVFVKPGESFRLRYGVLLHAGPPDAAPDLKAAYADFLSRL